MSFRPDWTVPLHELRANVSLGSEDAAPSGCNAPARFGSVPRSQPFGPHGMVNMMNHITMDDYAYDSALDPAWDQMSAERPKLVSLLLEQRARILANWAVRVATLPAFRAMPGLALGDIQRNMPDVLDGVIGAIASSSGSIDPAVLEQAMELAGAHGRARLLDEFSLADLLTEFHALRQEVWATLWRALDTDPELLEMLPAVADRIAETFDQLTIAAAEAWATAARNRLHS